MVRKLGQWPSGAAPPIPAVQRQARQQQLDHADGISRKSRENGTSGR
jgi:hypothetical protein